MCRRYWYYYVGSGDETDPINYTRLPINPSDVCTCGQTICAIYACPNSVNQNLPNAGELNGTIKSYIVAARLVGCYYPVFPQKPYVYLKNP